MEVGQAIGEARDYLSAVFAGEDVTDVRLEEVVHDEKDNGASVITFGLMRPAEMRGLPVTNFNHYRQFGS